MMSDEAARSGNQHFGLISHGSRLRRRPYSVPCCATPPKWDGGRLTTRMPRRMRAYNTQARRRSPDNITSITGYLVENRTHAMLLVRPSRTLERRPKRSLRGFGRKSCARRDELASVRRTLQGRRRGQVLTTKRADFCDQQRYAA